MNSFLVDLNAAGDSLIGWMVPMLAWTAGILVVALVADRLLRRRIGPGARIVLFAMVFLRLAVPADWEAPAGVVPAPEPAPIVVTAQQAASPSASAAPAMAMPQQPAPSGLDWGAVALLVYALGCGLLVSALARGHMRLRSVVRDARPASAAIAALGGCFPVLTHANAGPLVAGLVRPRIILPDHLTAELTVERIEAIIAHESAHAIHRDPWLVTALSLACALLWPLLPLWIAAGRIRLLIEMRADAFALRSAEVGSYRKLLLDLATRRWLSPVPSASFGAVAGLQARVAALGSAYGLPIAFQLGVSVAIGAAVLVFTGFGTEDPIPAPIAPAAVAAGPLPTCGEELEYPQPDTPQQREVAATLRERLAHAATTEAVVAVWRDAAAAGINVVAAEARLNFGQRLAAQGEYDRANKELAEAAWLGASVKYDRVAVDAASTLVVVEYLAGDVEEATSWARHADAAIRRVRETRPAEIGLRRTQALIAAGLGDDNAAAAFREREAELTRRCSTALPAWWPSSAKP